MRAAYALRARSATLVGGRAHAEATPYRIECDEGSFFLKLSPQPQGDALVLVRFLADAGIDAVVAPMPSRAGRLFTTVAGFSVTLYPFIEGENGFRAPLGKRQWAALGTTLRSVHAATPPPSVTASMRVETYADHWRRKTHAYLEAAPDRRADGATRDLFALLDAKRAQIGALVEHAEQLAASLARRALPFVPCHGDIHAGNVLVDGDGQTIAIIDWDDPVLAPKERDLMFIGAGIGHAWNRPDEARAFYRGYGPADIDAEAIAYYRCDRIVEDVAVFCDRVLTGDDDGGADRRLLVRKLAGAFDPNDVVEIAERTFAAL